MGTPKYKQNHFLQGLCLNDSNIAVAGKMLCPLCEAKMRKLNAVDSNKFKIRFLKKERLYDQTTNS